MRKMLLFILLIQVGMIGSQRAHAKGNPRGSIARGYFGAVEKDLAGKAYCPRYTTSMFLGNPDYLDELKTILKRYRFSVIHVNNGLHGSGYTEEQYRQSLPKLMDTLKKYSKGAVVIWASTTPRRSPEMIAPLVTDNEKVKERNRIAVEYMTQHGIEVDDLFGLVAQHSEYYNLPQDVTHFNPRGQTVPRPDGFVASDSPHRCAGGHKKGPGAVPRGLGI